MAESFGGAVAGVWSRGPLPSAAGGSSGTVGSRAWGLPRLRGQVALPPRALRRLPGWLSWRACWRGLAIEAFAGVLPCLAPAPPLSGQAALVVFARPACDEAPRWRGEWAVVGERAATDLRPSGAAVPP